MNYTQQTPANDIRLASDDSIKHINKLTTLRTAWLALRKVTVCRYAILVCNHPASLQPSAG